MALADKKDAYCRYEMEKQQNRRAQVDTADDAEGVLVGEMVDAFDDADETAVVDDTAVAAVELVGKKVADADCDKDLADCVEREE